MAITLPKTKAAATRKSPSILITYAMPKVGKTKSLSELENCLILDGEKGTQRYDSMSVPTENYAQMQEVLVALSQAWQANDKKPVYKYIAVDTVEQLEDIAVHKAAEFYKQTPMGKTWYNKNYKSPGVLTAEGEKINMLPNGAGYGYIREAMKWYIEILQNFCEHLILVAHVKDKRLPAMDGAEEVIVKDINLTGKLGSILCAQADAIGYMYRTPQGQLMISFQTNENSVMGSRCPHLAGQKFEMDWGKIFID